MPLNLPPRIGPQPKTDQEPPQLQYSDISPPHIVEALKAWAFSALDHAREEPTRISVPTARALWLDEAVAASPDAFMPPRGSREFAHFHEDGSMHVVLSDEDERAVMSANWGIPHVYRHKGVKEMLIFAPRDDAEAETVKTIVQASYDHAMSGRF
ncbi:hypothetical protein KX928_23850 [Roseobacter sp. YSTF-M11]|uniref:Luciferase domain-containing protein n=1 Tax=Roseobacter insulae TaxID=2859783 RepID=A0A9X1K111_9RHOB|nr:luciferase family protein [Roseobacter insulae]MBW4710835.1 hypothetical protein [Roseobacter insulae]